MADFKDACMVKPGFKPVPPHLNFEFSALFSALFRPDESGEFKPSLGRNWFVSESTISKEFFKNKVVLTLSFERTLNVHCS